MSPTPGARPTTAARLLRPAAWAATLALGLVQTWALRHTMFEDGPSYLDVGDAFARGDWHGAVNAYWSPLYAWTLGVVLRVARPSAYWEYPVVHLVNLALLLAALRAFEAFQDEWLAWRRETQDAEGPPGGEVAWRAFGYAAFLAAMLGLVGMRPVTPDVLTAAFALAAGALALRLRRPAHEGSRGLALALGAVLGLGYLAKVAILPLSIAWLAAAFAGRGARARWPGAARAAAVLALVAAPFVLALSAQKGRLTVGDSPRLNRAFALHALAERGIQPVHWRGLPPGSGTPAHPTRLVYAALPTYEYAGPVAGTFGPWRDPSWYLEGLTPPGPLSRRQVALVALHLRQYVGWTWPLLAALVALVALRGAGALGDVRAAWPALLPSAAAFGMYALVHAESRFFGAFVPMLALGLAGAPRVAAGRARGARWTLVLAGALLLLPLARALPGDLRRAHAGMPDRGGQSPIHGLATSLRTAGVRPGERIGVVGIELRAAPWARLAGVRVTASVPMPVAGRFWTVPAAVRDSSLAAMAACGVAHVVTAVPPPGGAAPGWLRLPRSSAWLLALPAGDSSACRAH